MSKKQREKVESEVRYHQAQLVRPQQAPSSTPTTEASPDSSVFDQQPSSTNQLVPYVNGAGGGYVYNGDLASYAAPPNGYSYASAASPQTVTFELGNSDFADSTTFDQQHHLDSTSDTNSLLMAIAPGSSGVPLEPQECKRIIDMFSKTVTNAHSRTCLMSTEQIQELISKGQDITQVMFFKIQNLRGILTALPYLVCMAGIEGRLFSGSWSWLSLCILPSLVDEATQEQLWLDTAQRLTELIQQIIEFAKMIPGFMKISQDDQILLLKAGSFELCLLRMTRYYDPMTGGVLYGQTLMPLDVFMTTDTSEMKLVSKIMEFAKEMTEMKLTPTELGLFSAYVLISPDRQGLRNTSDILKLNQYILRALRCEVEKTHKYSLETLLSKEAQLQELSGLYLDALAKFKRTMPNVNFPDLHKELFPTDTAVIKFEL
ncbi:RORB [Cordylochernes scorpioides]|uniref:RORB n=1 Tax=Cordylochernes scorpioides TaxID=51811 RepID=A0ABY6KJ23_9ARAC|nr:RORB [Cordylochernes scorpioides]